MNGNNYLFRFQAAFVRMFCKLLLVPGCLSNRDTKQSKKHPFPHVPSWIKKVVPLSSSYINMSDSQSPSWFGSSLYFHTCLSILEYTPFSSQTKQLTIPYEKRLFSMVPLIMPIFPKMPIFHLFHNQFNPLDRVQLKPKLLLRPWGLSVTMVLVPLSLIKFDLWNAVPGKPLDFWDYTVFRSVVSSTAKSCPGGSSAMLYFPIPPLYPEPDSSFPS